MDSDTGKACGISVKADKTVTFTAPKRGMLSNESVDLCGEIVIAEVGIPVDYNSISESTCVPLTKKLVKTMVSTEEVLQHTRVTLHTKKQAQFRVSPGFVPKTFSE